MRSDPAEYELVAPGSLTKVVSLLAEQPGAWLPIAGGTDVMVQYASGKLAAHRLVSLWNLPELRRIEVSDSEVSIGAGCTYADLRAHKVIALEFPLLTTAARWTGGIANAESGDAGWEHRQCIARRRFASSLARVRAGVDHRFRARRAPG